MTDQPTTAEEIVRALAKAEPVEFDDHAPSAMAYWCALCNASAALEVFIHDPACPWRLALEWDAEHPRTRRDGDQDGR